MAGGTPGETASVRAARIGGARADFVASLGRRVGELRATLKGIETDRGSPRLRDELRRRVHALVAGARLLRFDAMATALADCERRLEQAAAAGTLDADDVAKLGEAFERLPELAWGEPTHEQRATERPPPPEPVLGETLALPATALVIGPAQLADALTHELGQPGDPAMEVERTETASVALDLARALAPDVAVVDVDVAGGRDLALALLDDPLTEPMPLVVVGTFAAADQAAKLLSLGVARALPKPVSPDALRRACAEVAAAGKSNAPKPLGEPTIEELAERLSDEIRRGLCEAAGPGSAATRVPLGDGTEVLAAVWGALARVRELVTIKSDGAVRFAPTGPEGALPIASFWDDGRAAADRATETRGAPAKLDGRRIVVADDDPAVTWFLSGVLRAAGATVFEAHDGKRALEICCRVSPHLVVSDVLMPEMDGFALCRALKRDIALRDVPVVLLSWKEDLLQRLRELGADADAYLRKDLSAATVVQRIGEVLRTRSRIEARLAGAGEVRGRLDGLTIRSLLEIVATTRPDARLSVRDASFLYELEVRGGAPKSVTRTTPDGAFQRGVDVFAALLGVRAGRFVIASASGAVRAELAGDLAAQLAEPIARARGAMRVLSGTRLLEAQRIDVAVERVEAYLRATPEPARSLVKRLANGASPRTMVVGGDVAPRLLEDVLADLASHAAITGVRGGQEVDLLGPAVAAELSAIRRGATPSLAPPPPTPLPARVASPTPPAATTPAPQPTEPASDARRTVPRPALPRAEAKHEPTIDELAMLPDAGPIVPAPIRELLPTPTPSRTEASEPASELTPSSLEDAVIRELSDRTPEPGTPAPPSSGDEPSIVAPGALRARNVVVPDPTLGVARAPSLPPDAIVPAAEDEKPRIEMPTDEVLVPAAPSIPPVAPVETPLAPHPEPTAFAKTLPAAGVQPVVVPEPPKSAPEASSAPTSNAASVAAPAPAPRSNALVWLLVVALAGGALYFGVRASQGPAEDPSAPASSTGSPPMLVSNAAPPPTAPASVVAAALSAAPADAASSVETSPEAGDDASSAPGESPAGEDLPLPNGSVLAAGQGLLEVDTGGRDAVFIDKMELGRGPLLRVALAPGMHEVRVKAHGEERVRFVLIRIGRRTRLPLGSPWRR